MSNLSLGMCFDKDFIEQWHKEDSDLCDSVLSRMGYVDTFCGCPITQCSKLQSCHILWVSYYTVQQVTEWNCTLNNRKWICCSSAATYNLLHLWFIINYIDVDSFINLAPFTIIRALCLPPSKAFENNNACLALAMTETHFKPKTHISINLHHFHGQVRIVL